MAKVMEADLWEPGVDRIGTIAFTDRVSGKMGRAAADEKILRKTGHAALGTEVRLQLIEKGGWDANIADRGLRFDRPLPKPLGISAADADQAGGEVDIRPVQGKDFAGPHAGIKCEDKKHHVLPFVNGILGGGNGCGCRCVKTLELLCGIVLQIVLRGVWHGLTLAAEPPEGRLCDDAEFDGAREH